MSGHARNEGPGGCVPWEKYVETFTRMHRLEAAISGHREMKKSGALCEKDDQFLYAILDERESNPLATTPSEDLGENVTKKLGPHATEGPRDD